MGSSWKETKVGIISSNYLLCAKIDTLIINFNLDFTTYCFSLIIQCGEVLSLGWVEIKVSVTLMYWVLILLSTSPGTFSEFSVACKQMAPKYLK